MRGSSLSYTWFIRIIYVMHFYYIRDSFALHPWQLLIICMTRRHHTRNLSPSCTWRIRLIYVTHPQDIRDEFSSYMWLVLTIHVILLIMYVMHSHPTYDSFASYTWLILIFCHAGVQRVERFLLLLLSIHITTALPLGVLCHFCAPPWIHSCQSDRYALSLARARAHPLFHSFAHACSHPPTPTLTLPHFSHSYSFCPSLSVSLFPLFSLFLSFSLSPSHALARALSLLSQTGYTEVLDVSCCASLGRCCSFLGGCIVGSAEPAQYAMTTDFSGSPHKLHHTATHIPQHTASRPQQHSNTI